MTSQIIPADPDNARSLARYANEIRTLRKRASSDIVEIGRMLIESKKLAGHGNWLSWLEREFQWTADTALNYMRVHDLVKNRNFRDLSNIPVSGLFLLAAPSTPEGAKQEAVSRAEAGEPMTLNTVKEIVGRTRQADRRDARVEWKTETRGDFIGRLIRGKDNLFELITDYLNRLKHRREKNIEWPGPRPAAADNELRKAFQKEAILEIFELQATYWHDDIVREALGAAIDHFAILQIQEKKIEMKTTIIAIAVAAMLASGGAR
jgi:hypothetical protein